MIGKPKIKGTTPPQFPHEWRYWVKINKDDTDIEKSEKYKYNSMVVKKKPYFFIYLYKSLMDEYKKYEKNFTSISRKYFGLTIKELLRKENKTQGELSLIRKYRKYSPVLETECIMNILCKCVENTEFDIKYKKNAKGTLINFADNNIEFDEIKLQQLTELYREYKSQKRYKGILSIIDNEGIQDDDINEIMNNIILSHKDEYREKMYDIFSSSKELFNYLIEICKRNNYKENFIWDILKEDILDIIPDENSLIIVDDENGIDYLGRTYNLKEVSNDNI